MSALIYALSFILLVGAGIFALGDLAHMTKLAFKHGVSVEHPDTTILVPSSGGGEQAIATQEAPLATDEYDEQGEIVPQAPQSRTYSETSNPSPTSRETTVYPEIKTADPVPSERELEKPRDIGGGLRAIFFKDTDDNENVRLFVSGVLQHTNAERFREGLPPLVLNATLNYMAQVKLDDMFAQDYFDHDSPQGVGVSDLADNVGYEYLLVGENLAFGDFRDNRHLVDSWMDSPGHRANIMHEKYSEIGIAVGFGEFEGKETWMAVQEFGLPRSVWPYPSEDLRVSIETQTSSLKGTKDVIDAKRDELQELTNADPSYIPTIETFNALVADYNAAVERQKGDIATYNSLVEQYNVCIGEKT